MGAPATSNLVFLAFYTFVGGFSTLWFVFCGFLNLALSDFSDLALHLVSRWSFECRTPWVGGCCMQLACSRFNFCLHSPAMQTFQYQCQGQ